MKLFTMIKDFRNDESGAVTVDWVVLTAAIVGLGIAVYGVVSGGIQNLSNQIDTQLRLDHIDTAFGSPAANSNVAVVADDQDDG